jgi:hypothetical protein
MRSIAFGAAVVVLAACTGDLIAIAAGRRQVLAAATTGELLEALAHTRDVHRLALVVAGVALVVALFLLRRAALWCWLLWAAFIVRVVLAYAMAPAPLAGQQVLLDAAARPTVRLRQEILAQLDAIVPAAGDAFGLVLLTAAIAGELFLVLVLVLRRRVADAP